MIYSTKNKILLGVLIALLLANIATITVFWLGRTKKAVLPKGPPTEFLVKELDFDALQKASFLALVQEHRKAADSLREEIKTAKDNFFKLLQQPQVTDAEKTASVQNISRVSEQLDLKTFDHFKKVRSLCNAGQQKKFDGIIQDVMHMIGGPGQGAPGMRDRQRPMGPPPGDREGGPPPGGENGPPPR